MLVMTDGSCKGNPGPGSIGWVIWCGKASKPTVVGNDSLGDHVTVNVAEWSAALRGVEECVAMGAEKVRVIVDSQCVQRQYTGEYTVNPGPIRPLYERMIEISREVPVEIIWVPRQVVRLAHEAAQGGFSSD